MIWDLLFSDHGYFVYREEYKQQQILEVEIHKLQAEKENLNAKIINLRENPKALEEVIHRELGYVYPDEYMLILPNKNKKNTEVLKQKKEEE